MFGLPQPPLVIYPSESDLTDCNLGKQPRVASRTVTPTLTVLVSKMSIHNAPVKAPVSEAFVSVPDWDTASAKPTCGLQAWQTVEP